MNYEYFMNYEIREIANYIIAQPKLPYCKVVIHSIWVIPCQINKEFRVTSRILMKLGVFVVPVVLITRANF